MASVVVHTPDAAEREPVETHAWREEVLGDVAAGARPVTITGRPDGEAILLTAVSEVEPGLLRSRRTRVERGIGLHALTADLPALHAFEREIHEQHGVRVAGHPWMKPIRFEGGGGQSAMAGYRYHRVEGKDVHEVAVGPIHAGVIEPGSFRFMCHGEQVLHLEIQLGYQHRGVEALLLESPPRALTPLVETIAGDTSVGHAWAYCAALERLAGVSVSEEVDRSRGLLLELERVGMHLSSLAGLAADIGFLQGATTYGRLRTTAINTTMRLCGSRFGRGGVRPGGAAYAFGGASREAVRAAVALLTADLAIVDRRFLNDTTVQLRLKEVGVVPTALAREVGLVGMAARASGVALDHRAGGIWGGMAPVVEPAGDCWSRAVVRIREMQASLEWIRALVEEAPDWERARATIGPLAPDQLAVAVVEGWRGEIVHALETDGQGALRHYKVQDPSLRNWLGLALAVRGEEISDFPICNKSFDLSYCGHDL